MALQRLLNIFTAVLHLFSDAANRRSAELLAGGLAVGDANGHCEPTKVRLALTGNPSEMRVSWITPSKGCKHHVYFGRTRNSDDQTELDDNGLDFIVDNIFIDTYKAEDFCGEPAMSDNFPPPNLHTAVLTDLIPGEWYKYRIGKHWQKYHFRAAAPIQPDAKFTFVAYGDMGESTHRAAKSPGAYLTAGSVTKEVLQGDTSLVVHLGDIAYADGLHKIWNSFLEEIEPYASHVPYQIVVGNHEYDWKTGKEHHHHKHPTDASGKESAYNPDWGNYGNDSGGECGVTVSKLFVMPGSDFVSSDAERVEAANHREHVPNPPFWFSYDYGSVHFVTVSSEHDLTKGSHQWKWLKQDLAGVDRCMTPWLVVLIHRPLYVVHPHKSNRVVGEHLRKSLEDLLEEHEVDLVLSGHVHAYARTCNMYNARCIGNDDGGMTHVTLGNGGRKLSEVKHEQPDWLEYADRKFGYARVSVHGSKHLLFEYVSSETQKVRDSVLLSVAPSAMRRCNFESGVLAQ